MVGESKDRALNDACRYSHSRGDQYFGTGVHYGRQRAKLRRFDLTEFNVLALDWVAIQSAQWTCLHARQRTRCTMVPFEIKKETGLDGPAIPSSDYIVWCHVFGRVLQRIAAATLGLCCEGFHFTGLRSKSESGSISRPGSGSELLGNLVPALRGRAPLSYRHAEAHASTGSRSSRHQH